MILSWGNYRMDPTVLAILTSEPPTSAWLRCTSLGRPALHQEGAPQAAGPRATKSAMANRTARERREGAGIAM